jgi:hypothetical protein
MERGINPDPVQIVLPPRRQTVLWIIAILLAIIATTLVVRGKDLASPPAAYAEPPMAGARGVFAFTGQLDKNRYGLFMMDVDSSNLWCYEFVPTTRKLRLVAARSFRWDRYLEDYQNEEPFPPTVQTMLKEQNRIQDRLKGGGVVAPEPSTKPQDKEEEGALSPNIPGFSQ